MTKANVLLIIVLLSKHPYWHTWLQYIYKGNTVHCMIGIIVMSILMR